MQNQLSLSQLGQLTCQHCIGQVLPHPNRIAPSVWHGKPAREGVERHTHTVDFPLFTPEPPHLCYLHTKAAAGLLCIKEVPIRSLL